jgi:hypothetical protein
MLDDYQNVTLKMTDWTSRWGADFGALLVHYILQMPRSVWLRHTLAVQLSLLSHRPLQLGSLFATSLLCGRAPLQGVDFRVRELTAS